MPSSTSKTYVRVAKPEEYGKLAVLARKAFIHDSLLNYLRSSKQLVPNNIESKDTQEIDTFFLFFLQTCQKVGGRITVAVISSETNSPGATEEEKIVSAAFWCPPNKRLALWDVPTLIGSGVIGVLRMWGWTVLKRISLYMDPSHAAQEEVYKTKGISETPDSTWYLQLIFTDPAYHGQGFMSTVMREAYDNASTNGPFVLEATSANSRDRYAHLGFEMVKECIVGKGQVDAGGLAASGEEAIGFPIWIMINWNPKRVGSEA